MVWEEPDELFIPEAHYIQDHGSPSRNGLGHRREANKRGEPCVVVVESAVMRRKKQHVEKAVMKSVVDDGKDLLVRGQVENKFRTLGDSIRGAPSATGRPMPRTAGASAVLKSVSFAPSAPVGPTIGKPTSTEVLKTRGRTLLRRKSSYGSEPEQSAGPSAPAPPPPVIINPPANAAPNPPVQQHTIEPQLKAKAKSSATRNLRV